MIPKLHVLIQFGIFDRHNLNDKDFYSIPGLWKPDDHCDTDNEQPSPLRSRYPRLLSTQRHVLTQRAGTELLLAEGARAQDARPAAGTADNTTVSGLDPLVRQRYVTVWTVFALRR